MLTTQELELTKQLNKFSKDPLDIESNIALAKSYFEKGQYASAVSFLNRIAELSEDKDQIYESMCLAAECFVKFGGREEHVKICAMHAVSQRPNRPEAYLWLSLGQEYQDERFGAYTAACIGLENLLNAKNITGLPFPYIPWRLYYQKGINAWWSWRVDECRNILYDLYVNYNLDEFWRNNLRWNLEKLGYPEVNSRYHAPVEYTESMYEQFNLKFPGIKKIKKNYSQAGQDLFVLKMLDGKTDGTYLEIGSQGPFHVNNTALLEELGWSGVGVEIDQGLVTQYNLERKNKAIQANALDINYTDFLNYHFDSKVIDYLSLDIDPAINTFDCLKKLPLDDFTFKVITYEHDHFQNEKYSVRQKSRDYLLSKGYKLVVGNVSPDHNSPFEDWWVHPDYVEDGLIKDAINDKRDVIDIREYLYTEKEKKKWDVTDWPTMEFTTSVPKKGCVVDCVFCPQEVLKKSFEGERRLTLENFKKALSTIPKNVRITFSGFVEPWMNKQTTDMLLYAHEQGYPVCVFTTGIGMSVEDVKRIKDVPFAGGPNGGFTLHLPDSDHLAKHPITDRYIKVIEEFAKHDIQNFSIMIMGGEVHEKVKHIYPSAPTYDMWWRAGNLITEAKLKPELIPHMGRVNTIHHEGPTTCGCIEDLYHNIMLPNGNVALCCMDYNGDHILGNLLTQSYEEIMPEQGTAYSLCNFCENGVNCNSKK